MMKVLPLPSLEVMLSLRCKRYTMGNSDSLANRVKFRFLISTRCCVNSIDKGLPCSFSYGFLCVPPLSPRESHLSVTVVKVRIDASAFPFVGQGRQLYLCRHEATPRFAHAAAHKFAQLPFGAFVRKLRASGYPLHLPQATWANCRTPTVEL